MALAAIKPKNAFESFREVVQDLLVPELKSIKVSIDSLRTKMQLRDEKQTQAVQHLSDKLDVAMNVRERLAAIEARLPKK
jgi:hypothetical protein